MDSKIRGVLSVLVSFGGSTIMHSYLCIVESKRHAFLFDTMDAHQGMPRLIRREFIYDDVIDMYRDNESAILNEFPFRISYESEQAVDTGGICRDMYSAFWEEVYLDGERLLIPAVHPNADMQVFRILGTILAHGCMVCGFLPIRIAFPTITAVLCGPEVPIMDNVLLECFIDFITEHESSIIREAIFVQRMNLVPSFKIS